MINRFLTSLFVAGALIFISAPADAQVKPFKVNGGGTAPDGLSIFGEPGNHNATGNGNFLGRYTGDEGVFQSLSFDPDTLSGTFKGSFVFVAANGDRLVFSYGDQDNGAAADGEYFAVPAGDGLFQIIFCAEFNPILAECTGRFEKVVRGSFIMLAMTEPFELSIDENGYTPPFAYSWEGAGTLEFRKGR